MWPGRFVWLRITVSDGPSLRNKLAQSHQFHSSINIMLLVKYETMCEEADFCHVLGNEIATTKCGYEGLSLKMSMFESFTVANLSYRPCG